MNCKVAVGAKDTEKLFTTLTIQNVLLLVHVTFPYEVKSSSAGPLFSQVPDRDFPFHVGQSGHWPGHLSVCGGSSLVST